MASPETMAGMPPQAEPHHLRRVLVQWVILSVLGVVGTVLALPSILPQTGSDSERFANLTIVVFTAAAVPVVLFVWVFLGYSLVVFRVKEKPTEDGPALQPSPATQIGWLSVTGALCLFLIVWGLFGAYEQTVASSPNALAVKVVGQQWTWTYSYPRYGVSSHVLELPLGRPVQFSVTSLDVLHGFAITELGVRMDANPGEVVALPLVTPDRIGSYQARCIELCGLYHSVMFTEVRIVSTHEFNAWIRNQGGHL